VGCNHAVECATTGSRLRPAGPAPVGVAAIGAEGRRPRLVAAGGSRPGRRPGRHRPAGRCAGPGPLRGRASRGRGGGWRRSGPPGEGRDLACRSLPACRRRARPPVARPDRQRRPGLQRHRGGPPGGPGGVPPPGGAVADHRPSGPRGREPGGDHGDLVPTPCVRRSPGGGPPTPRRPGHNGGDRRADDHRAARDRPASRRRLRRQRGEVPPPVLQEPPADVGARRDDTASSL
jgi:hypothetical protein